MKENIKNNTGSIILTANILLYYQNIYIYILISPKQSCTQKCIQMQNNCIQVTVHYLGIFKLVIIIDSYTFSQLVFHYKQEVIKATNIIHFNCLVETFSCDSNPSPSFFALLSQQRYGKEEKALRIKTHCFLALASYSFSFKLQEKDFTFPLFKINGCNVTTGRVRTTYSHRLFRLLQRNGIHDLWGLCGLFSHPSA